MNPRLPAIALAGLLAGCASQPLWITKSPDRRQTVRLLEDGGRQRVLLGDREIGRHDGVAVSTFTFSRDGKQWAYAARQGKTWEVRSTLGTSGPWDGIGELRFSPQGHRLAFSAERQGSWHALVDFHAGPGFQELLQGAFLFSADGNRFAYAGLRAGKTRVVVDQEMGPEFDGVADLGFDTASLPFYAARRGDSAFVLRGGISGATYASVRDLTVHPEGKSLAWVARIGNRDVAIHDGIQTEKDYARILPGSLVFPPGAEKAAYRAAAGGGKQVLVQGGEEGPAFEELTAPSFGPSGEVGYAGRSGKTWSIIIGNREVAREDWAGAPVFGAGGRYVYAARRPEGLCVIAGSASHCFDVLLDDTLVFGPDGRSWGCLAGHKRDGKLHYIVDGKAVKELDLGEVAGEALKGASDGTSSPAREWVRAEIALIQAATTPKPRLP